MHAHLQCDFQVRLLRLVPAFPWRIVPTSGKVLIRRRGFERALVAGQQLTVEPFELIELLLDGSYAQPSACTLEVQCDRDGEYSGNALHRAISQRVFLHPQHAWDAGYLSRLLDMPALEIRRKLFSQGYALTDIRRTQRLMRALFEVQEHGSRTEALRRCTGWPEHGDLESAFHDRFGISLLTARRLSGPSTCDPMAAMPTFHRKPRYWAGVAPGMDAHVAGAY